MEPITIYHERQSRQLCLLHSLNNLFQRREFSRQDFDEFCDRLSPNTFINPHRSLLPGVGNYDINVLIAALESKGYDAVWFDKRKKLTQLNLDKIFGFILNLPLEKGLLAYLNPLSYFIEIKHWIALRKLEDGSWYNLNSNLSKPRSIGDDDEFLEFLGRKNKKAKCQILVIVEKSKRDEVYFKEENPE